MLTCSSAWIFNQMRYNGLHKFMYDLYLLGVVYFTCIEIRTPSSTVEFRKRCMIGFINIHLRVIFLSIISVCPAPYLKRNIFPRIIPRLQNIGLQSRLGRIWSRDITSRFSGHIKNAFTGYNKMLFRSH